MVQLAPTIPAIAAALLCAASGRADTPQRPAAAPRIELSAGWLEAFDAHRPGGFGLAYRWRPLGRWSLAPGAGLLAASDGARFIHADLSRSFDLGPAWYVAVVFGAGHFRDGSTVRLGHHLEFRSGLELGRRIGGRWRLGLGLDHLSNAGLSGHNPGTEILMLRLSVAPREPAQPAVAAPPDPPVAPPAAPAAASWSSSSRRISSPASAR